MNWNEESMEKAIQINSKEPTKTKLGETYIR